MKKLTNLILAVVVALATYTINVDFHRENNVAQNTSSISVSFNNTVEAKSRFEREWEKAVDKIERRTINRTVDRIEDRINDHIDDTIDLLDPDSKEYRKWSMQRLFNSLPYGETQVLVKGSKATQLKRIVNDSPNAAVVGYIYKRGVNGKKGPKVGLVILKSADLNDIYYTE